MNKINPKLEKIRPEVIKILKKNKAKKASFFGSYVRGEEKKSSDIDMLVELGKGQSLLDLVGLEQELEDKFKKKFDLITYRSVNPLLKESIFSSEVRII
jgi:uncharacterized protein